MAKIYPVLTDSQLRNLPSQAEAKVYCRLRDDLSDDFLIIHGRSYVATRRDGSHGDGEADFVIFSASHGLLTVEVKGGGVAYSPETGWQSVDRLGNTHGIKDPVAQARSQKYAFLGQLQMHREWNVLRRRIALGHAILLPDVDRVEGIALPECPHEIVGGSRALQDVAVWLSQVYGYWEGDDCMPLGLDGLRVVEQALCHAVHVRPLLRDVLEDDNAVRLRLTAEQASVLRTLGRRRRAGIVGAAGTGKTILALEKARMLANAGARVLLLCYNKPLGAVLNRQFAPAGKVFASTFHQFCQHCCRRSVEAGRSDPMVRVQAEVPADDYFDIQLPLAAFYAIEGLGDELRFDAVVIDEGQDFGEEFWLPVEMALKSSEDSWLYVFYDENQRLYSRVSSFPIPESETYPLTKNCRNSKPVHDFAYRYYDGAPADDSGIAGVDPVALAASNPRTQAQKIARKVTELIHDEAVPPSEIAVLVAGHPKEQYYDLLSSETLPRPAKWSREEHFQEQSVLMDTVRRFKGLERDVIFLWLDGESAAEVAVMYVGISRAKSVLYVVGDPESLEQLRLSEPR
ncbi:MAG: NERD domain-containing protein [Thermoguttaceae bacterium]|nr:NERD domain-containing protein [Thermoguttaceae bacterium]